MFGNLHPSFTFGFYSGEITETESFSFIANLKIEFFYSTSGKFTKNNHPSGSVYSMVYLSVCCGGVMFAIGFVCLLVGGLCLLLGLSVCWLGGNLCYWVCLFVGLWTCHNIFVFISRDGVRGHGGRVVTLSPPTSEAGVRSTHGLKWESW